MRNFFALPIVLVCLLAAPAFCADDAAALLKKIQSPETPDVDRANAFEKIGDIAGDDAVAPLAGFLGDKKWSHYARYALQKMEGHQATEALLKSLGSLQGDLKLGVICSIGRRQDPIATAPLTKLLADTDAKLAESAAVALGWIATPDAAAALSKAFSAEKDSKRQVALGSALLLVGQRLARKGNSKEAVAVFDLVRNAELPKPYRIAATQNEILARGGRGVELMVEQLKTSDPDFFETGLAAARVLPGQSATKALINLLGKESLTNRQVLLILAMKDRGDKRALPAVLSKLKSDLPAVKLAAIDAVGVLGDASSVPALLSAAQGDAAEASISSLVALKGDDVNGALMKEAKKPATAPAAVKALGKRRVKESLDLYFEIAKSDSAAAQEAIGAIGKTVPDDKFSDLIDMLKTAKNNARKAAIQDAIHSAIIRSTKPDICAETLGPMISDARGADREFLFEQILTAGGAKAVECMRKFATGSDVALQDAATKTLGRWLSADAGPALLEVANGKSQFANRALGGYIRLFRQFELPEEQRVAMAAKALEAARRPQERNAAIEAMTRFPCVGTYELALAQLDAPGSKKAAAKAVLTIARTVLTLDPQKGKAGLKKLIDANISADVTAQAKELLK
ncbi:MAG: HEAT repeat domain-containing protein [Pirellulales bacterium]|nr:HEAT repeat domain-containing protein [Pirellulales bacterium]